MKVLIFTGSLESKENSTSERLTTYLKEQLEARGITSTVFRLADSAIPLFDPGFKKVPTAVEMMNILFQDADLQIWLTPLYHGGMTGVMKNCLDWLECSAKLPQPYLMGKIIGLSCWAEGGQAIQGINAMDAVAKALRAWTLPYNVPIQRSELFEVDGSVSSNYKERFDRFLALLLRGPKRLDL